MEWLLELSCLLIASQEYLKEVDPVTNWPPFVLTGMGESCDLRIIYDLLLEHPEHVEKSGDGSYIWEKSESQKEEMERFVILSIIVLNFYFSFVLILL